MSERQRLNVTDYIYLRYTYNFEAHAPSSEVTLYFFLHYITEGHTVAYHFICQQLSFYFTGFSYFLQKYNKLINDVVLLRTKPPGRTGSSLKSAPPSAHWSVIIRQQYNEVLFADSTCKILNAGLVTQYFYIVLPGPLLVSRICVLHPWLLNWGGLIQLDTAIYWCWKASAAVVDIYTVEAIHRWLTMIWISNANEHRTFESVETVYYWIFFALAAPLCFLNQ